MQLYESMAEKPDVISGINSLGFNQRKHLECAVPNKIHKGVKLGKGTYPNRAQGSENREDKKKIGKFLVSEKASASNTIKSKKVMLAFSSLSARMCFFPE